MKDRFKELAVLWFDKAKDDFDWANETFKYERFGGVCFLCQQAAEKALKAYLFSRKEKLLKTHNLPMLNEKCKKYSRDFSSLDSAVDILNAYYTDTRYPDIWDYNRFNDKKFAEEALQKAEKILNFISKKLK